MGDCLSTPVTAEQAAEADAKLAARRSKQPMAKNLVKESVVGSTTGGSVNGRSILNQYEVVKQLGVGSMGSVASVRLKSKSPSSSTTNSGLYAMKTLRLGRLTSEFQRELENEIRIVSDLDHPGIVKFHHVIRDGRQCYVVMDLCSGGDLYKRAPYSESQARDILQQLLSAVAYLHSRNYVHRDLKVRIVGNEKIAPIACFLLDNSQKISLFFALQHSV